MIRSLPDLLVSAGEGGSHSTLPPLPITGVALDSRGTLPGNLYVAVPGTRVDGHDFAADAVERGAAAVVAERPLDGLGVPVVRVADSYRALARIAAAWYGHPSDALSLVGVTGSFGKTTVVTMLDAMLVAAGQRTGAIGSESVGVRIDGRVLEESPYTTPDALMLQRSLALLRDAGADRVAMEVTSHALAQQRVHGLRYDVGAFTNLAPLEHMEFHGSFEHYVQSKLRFFDHLTPGAPLVFGADDPSLRRLTADLPGPRISCGAADDSMVRFVVERVATAGTRMRLLLRDGLPRHDADPVPPGDLVLDLPLLGRPYLQNAAFACTLALMVGAEPEHLREALHAFTPPRRRMQVIRCGGFTVLDDTAQHPDSMSAVFEVVERLPHRRVHAAYAVRGQRGPGINHQIATTLGIWTQRVAMDTLVVTSSEEAADARNRVDDEERDAFLQGLREAGVAHEDVARLDEGVRAVLDRAGPGDLVLLLGPFGMHDGAGILREWAAERGLEMDG